ncbi:hypothetical protein [Hafnia alvei]|uniref:Uncharacterized protein n=1 Tax=Hafnia alvei TaxID=569 RepID=A0A1C6Z7N2_HAFAL|nr:hypothetical protein [Hafnia alvei]NLS54891.1 hypothetical protein [Hafnia alvei]SCM54919.1 hypothetical protein BN1044_04431 [Hafnia alvei]
MNRYKNECLTMYRNKNYSIHTELTLFPYKSEIIVQSGFEQATVATSNATITDVKVSINPKGLNLAMTWIEAHAFGFTSLHYAEINERLEVVRTHEVESISTNNAAILPLSFICEEFLFIAKVECSTEQVTISQYRLSDFSLVSSPMVITSKVSDSYLSSKRNKIANLTVVDGGDNTFYLQYKVQTDSIHTLLLTYQDKTLSQQRLFDFAYDNIGFHETYLDKEEKMIFVTYANTESGDIYLAAQSLDPNGNHNLVENNVVISQTQGSYNRPYIEKCNTNYAVTWEGTNPYVIYVDKNLLILSPEEMLDLSNPANIKTAYDMSTDTLVMSAQIDNRIFEDYGTSFYYSKTMTKK